jgi:hypothetical protein
METQKLKEPGATPNVDPFNPLDQKVMPLHVQRMAAETQTVVTNLRKLSEFVENPSSAFASLPRLEQQLMLKQRDQMQDYARTLSLRYCMALLDHG